MEPGQPGWHHRPIRLEDAMHACLRLNEFMEQAVLGSYGPFAFEPRRVWLPAAGR